MRREGDKIENPLKPEEAIRNLLKMKPTADMTKPGAARKAKKKK